MYRSYYRILGLIGQGQFGRVFCAVDRQTGEIVALKDLELKRFPTHKFLREISYLLTLKHPNIVGCTGLEYNRTGRYVVMDYCEGGTLRDLINSQEQLSLKQKLNLVEDILSGLAHAHSRQIIHCDIKPENILLKLKPSSWSAHISDFGIARLIEEINSQSGGYTGSPAYMAPERFYGKHSFASDLYAVGIILFELLVGYRPFSGYPGELMTAHLSKTVTIPNTIPPLLSSIIEKALRKLPQRRFKSTEEMLKSVRLASETLGFNSSSVQLFTSLSSVPNATSLNIIHQVSLPQRVSHLAVDKQCVYLGIEDKLCCQIYPDSSLVGKPQEWQVPLKGSLVKLFSHSQGCLTVTDSPVNEGSCISYFRKSHDAGQIFQQQQVCVSRLNQISAIAPGGHWLAFISSSQVLQFLKLPNLERVKTSINCSIDSQLVTLDSRHGMIINSAEEKKPKTQFTLLTRRGNLWRFFSLSISLHSLVSNSHLPDQIFALEVSEKILGILINLKPLKVTRIPLEIKPDFILGQPWGFLLASRQGKVILLGIRGEKLGGFQVEEEITAMAFYDQFRLLMATDYQSEKRLYFINLEEKLANKIYLNSNSNTLS
ncbi:serine/threonine-protein kinase [Gloeothece verrucosa]|uniref:Serine/threonine protein kinase n=1 Tax=Gloeothece verrucosa (strain PCC 7822) TaxID=497965 RepID=E0UEB8_GLOV7|nr:serine/threonine-protein kinase [Gloeothece verrucosa]ADN15364.1 serine/threonine protein kinase [Gloeothece verrucosa PCC 7822]